jgi:hypothetical protein
VRGLPERNSEREGARSYGPSRSAGAKRSSPRDPPQGRALSNWSMAKARWNPASATDAGVELRLLWRLNVHIANGELAFARVTAKGGVNNLAVKRGNSQNDYPAGYRTDRGTGRPLGK